MENNKNFSKNEEKYMKATFSNVNIVKSGFRIFLILNEENNAVLE